MGDTEKNQDCGVKKCGTCTGEWHFPGETGARRQSAWFWPFGLLGLIGPLIGSVIWIIFLVAGIWILRLANIVFMSGFVALLIGAVVANLQWFFAVSLFLGYCGYFIRKTPSTAAVLWPVMGAVNFTFAMWIISWVFRTVGFSAGATWLYEPGIFIRANLIVIFAFVLVLGAISMAARQSRMRKN